MHVEGAAVGHSWTIAVGRKSVDGDMGLDTLEGVHVWSPFYEGEAVEHGQDTDVDAIVLQH